MTFLFSPHHFSYRSYRIKPLAFDTIALADTATLTFYSDVNIIGFDWKSYNFQTAQYTVKPYKNYIVRSRNGLYYKLRFLDFYKDGIKGNILFEYQLM
jgi:hypothetical protein